VWWVGFGWVFLLLGVWVFWVFNGCLVVVDVLCGGVCLVWVLGAGGFL